MRTYFGNCWAFKHIVVVGLAGLSKGFLGALQMMCSQVDKKAHVDWHSFMQQLSEALQDAELLSEDEWEVVMDGCSMCACGEPATPAVVAEASFQVPGVLGNNRTQCSATVLNSRLGASSMCNFLFRMYLCDRLALRGWGIFQIMISAADSLLCT